MGVSKKDDPFGEATRFAPGSSIPCPERAENRSKAGFAPQIRTTIDSHSPSGFAPLVRTTVDVAPHSLDPPTRPDPDPSPESEAWAPLYLDDEIVESQSVNARLSPSDFKALQDPAQPTSERPAPIRVKRAKQPARAREHASRGQQAADSAPPSPNRPAGPPSGFPAAPAAHQVPGSIADPKLIEGSRIGNYEVIRKIGQGGMGVVYEGRHLLLPRRVAIKFLLTNQSHDEEQIRRFLGEAVASAQIGHKGVVDIYDYGYDENKTAYLIMEYVDGQSLQAVMKASGQLPIPMVVRVVRDIAEVLEAAHQSGIVHRDLKPDNILLSRDEHGTDFVKILDFGVAKFVNDQGMSGQTVAGSILGTPWYMPPEQCQGLSHVDFRSDIYALGCVCYQMLCGKVPFAGSLRDVLTAHIHSEPTPPTQFNPSVPAALVSMLGRMMAKDPAHRPASMEEVARALDSLAEPSQRLPRAQTAVVLPATPQQKPARERSWLAPALAALLACAATAAISHFL